MPEPSSFPIGFTLRAAKAADKSSIQRLLINLERELTPPHSGVQQIVRVVFWSLLGTVFLSILLLRTVRLLLLQFLSTPAISIGMPLVLVMYFLFGQESRNYWVIECEGQVVACAKLQSQDSYSILFDVYVLPEWRKQGLGSHLVRALGRKAQKPLYLACLPARLEFYQRIGFSPVQPKALPLALQYDLGLLSRPGIIPLVLNQ